MSPLQKGGIENAIGRLRRGLPKILTCSDDLRIDNDSLFRHTGAGRYPSPLPPLDAGLRRHDKSKE